MVIYSLDSAFLNCERKFTPFEANAIRFPTTVVFLQHLCATVQCLIEADGAKEWEMCQTVKWEPGERFKATGRRHLSQTFRLTEGCLLLSAFLEAEAEKL